MLNMEERCIEGAEEQIKTATSRSSIMGAWSVGCLFVDSSKDGRFNELVKKYGKENLQSKFMR